MGRINFTWLYLLLCSENTPTINIQSAMFQTQKPPATSGQGEAGAWRMPVSMPSQWLQEMKRLSLTNKSESKRKVRFQRLSTSQQCCLPGSLLSVSSHLEMLSFNISLPHTGKKYRYTLGCLYQLWTSLGCLKL